MPEGQVLEFTNVTKRFNEVTAVSDFSARVEPGAVTAFLGPNGAGKTTTLRILLGQVRATSGTATIGGAAYAELRQPLRTIGAVLEETAYRPRRTASRQLTIAAKANGIRLARVDEVISLVGLEGEADTRIGGFSLGMRQRLSVAHALLGDPGALVFDEPANGLDPEGIRWMRLLMRRLADEGRTVLVSSHVLSEIEQVADHVLVLSKGRLVLSSGIETLADPAGGSVVVDSADRPGLTTALVAAGFDIEVLRSGLTVRGTDAGRVGAVAADAGIALSTLVQRGPTLEDVFIDLMRGGRFDTAPALDQTEAPAEEDPESATAAEAPAEESPTDGPSTDEAAGTAAAALAAGGTAALADDLTPQATGPVTAETIADDTAPTDEADATADEDATRALPVVSADDDATRILPVVDATADAQPADADTDAEAEDSPSFDDILFGAPAPVAESPRRSFAALFAAASADAETESSAQPAATDAPGEAEAESVTESESPSTTDETPAEDVDSAADAPADSTSTDAPDSASGDEEPAGVEFFTGLDASSADEEPAPSADTAEAAAPGEDASPASDDDPRSAAVSSMLAAAARAYYEDEPRDYPLAPAEETSSGHGAPQDEIASDESAVDTETPAEQHAPADDRGDEHHDEHRG
ncbi:MULTISPECIES: ATP-binding cassette domain-containing protein [Microbacterium]|uniref:ATP-binding cassette domain-containing protein n=1 Tax=Microbacterium TaxID=33882 RepID=UPI0026EEA411|nr:MULTISPECIES: ATP-binding cassette domain-containing protein [Microbacterium]